MTQINNDLINAAETGDESTLKLLLLHTDCDARFKNKQNVTALMSAAREGHFTCVQLLLPLSDALATDDDGWTALMYAARYGHFSCLHLLLPASDAFAKDKKKWTALMCAAIMGHTACIQSLLPFSDASVQCSESLTASDLARSNGYTSLADFIDSQALLMHEVAELGAATLDGIPRKNPNLRV